jgi:hypothetical protein
LFDERRFDAALHVYAAVGHAAKERQHLCNSIPASNLTLTMSARCSN